MCNNRSYYNAPVHQADMPRSFGAHGEGPVEDPVELQSTLGRAVSAVMEESRCALVDVVTQNA